ncbi:type IV pilus modification protein PilV [Endozoicomonas ascidiicola]|uniref:type IV pilus modification protein PilV n=1 Tax=Endozoicomonas ascidiicola TaxID=1698521 RepID=UPI000832E3F6|nr:type IV pilus modification protein PilV [Endozoicomonas ascidiicola]
MKKNGFTLIEVLVALILVSVAFMGMTRLLFESRKQIQEVQQRSVALNLANDLIGRMTANPGALEKYEKAEIKDIVSLTKNCQSSTDCNADQMAAYDLNQWSRSLVGRTIKEGDNSVGGLVTPVACIDVDGQDVTLSIAWRGKQAQKETTEPVNDADGNPVLDTDGNPVLDGRGTRPCGKDDANFKQVVNNDLRRLLEVTTTIGS